MTNQTMPAEVRSNDGLCMLDDDDADPVRLWAEIHRLRAAVQGPDGFATWQEAATAERVRRVRAERAIADLGLTPEEARAGAERSKANRRDAKRYRWLRNEAWAGYNQGRGLPHVFTIDGAGNRRTMLAEAALDDAVDRARALHNAKFNGERSESACNDGLGG